MKKCISCSSTDIKTDKESGTEQCQACGAVILESEENIEKIEIEEKMPNKLKQIDTHNCHVRFTYVINPMTRRRQSAYMQNY